MFCKDVASVQFALNLVVVEERDYWNGLDFSNFPGEVRGAVFTLRLEYSHTVAKKKVSPHSNANWLSNQLQKYSKY